MSCLLDKALIQPGWIICMIIVISIKSIESLNSRINPINGGCEAFEIAVKRRGVYSIWA